MSYIIDLNVSINGQEEQDLQKAGFTKINVNLNSGAGGNNTYLWYKKGDEARTVTRVQVSFNEEMERVLKKASYTKIEKNLNEGTTGVPIYMWFSRTKGDYDVPIVDINVTKSAESEAALLTAGGVWEEVSCNLNLGTGDDYVYAWLKRKEPIYICDVTATYGYDSDYQLFTDGYTRVDVNTNMGAAGGAEVFVWYRKTTDFSKSLSDLTISTGPLQYEEAEDEGFEVVKVNLNENTSGSEVYLWYKMEKGVKSVRTMVLLTNKKAVATYQRFGITVVKRNLNEGNRGDTVFLCYI